jgi:putative inorganic carbon (HCO3(-)) transporter
MGHSFLDFLFLTILAGIIIQRKGFARTTNSGFILLFIFVNYLAVWNSSLRFSLPMPVTISNDQFRDWKNYAEMIGLYFLVLNAVKTEDRQKIVVIIMAVVFLMVSIRSIRNFGGAGEMFNYGNRVAGAFEAAQLGPNEYAAFVAHFAAAFLGLFFLDSDPKRKLLYLGAVLAAIHPLLFSFSRGAYAGFLIALGFLGLVRKRILLVPVLVILLTWEAILPVSVVDRIKMTNTANGEIELSAGHRLILWNQAVDLFESHPVFGIGFGGFGLAFPEGELNNAHNYYMNTLSEQGIIGILLFIGILFMALFSGLELFRTGISPFHRALGLGFSAAVIACMITNLFGNRWSYFPVGGYLWVFWGLVDRSRLMSRNMRRSPA